MITEPIVFIFGAGVSKPYGYPLGIELMQKIISDLENTRNAFFADNIMYTPNQLSQFSEQLRCSQMNSIDAFVERRPEFMDIGKIFIAKQLILCEREFNIRNNPPDEGIYRYLYAKISSKWEDLTNNKISFITFNYDRSFEYFLFSALKNTYGKSDSEVATIIKSIPIIHVYGNLDPLPWQNKDGRDYGFFPNDEPGKLATILSASEGIKLLHENEIETNEFKQAFDLLNSASRIYFLGFSYFPSSMERLKIRDISTKFRTHPNYATRLIKVRGAFEIPTLGIMGSAFNIGEAERVSIIRKWDIDLTGSIDTALDFLRDYTFFEPIN